MDRTSAAIIGLGRIASLLEEDSRREKPCTHAGAISANPECLLVGGCDINEERRKLFAERWGVPVYADASEMIRTHNPQLLVIATHPDSHYDYCRLAADSGTPVVICEKPLADKLSAARKIANLAQRGGSNKQSYNTIILTNHERRYSADYIKAREILTSKKLGGILSVRGILYMGKSQRLLDVLWHDGTHMIDVIMFLTGAVLKHRKRWGAKLSANTGTAWLEGELRTHDKTPVIIEAGAGRDHLVFELEISCEKGRLRIGNGVFEIWESEESPYAEKFRSLKLTCKTFEGPTAYFTNMLADAVICAREKNRQPVSSAEDGLRVVEYLHSVKRWR